LAAAYGANWMDRYVNWKA